MSACCCWAEHTKLGSAANFGPQLRSKSLGLSLKPSQVCAESSRTSASIWCGFGQVGPDSGSSPGSSLGRYPPTLALSRPMLRCDALGQRASGIGERPRPGSMRCLGACAAPAETSVGAPGPHREGLRGLGANQNCFEIYGFDVLVDESLQPWLLEAMCAKGGGNRGTQRLLDSWACVLCVWPGWWGVGGGATADLCV